MSVKTFAGGVHPPYYKELSASSQIEDLPAPQQVIIPLIQHIGAPCQPTVEAGDEVAMGEVVGDTDAFVSAPVHASVSGTVKEIGETALPDGRKVQAIIIESDGEDRISGEAALQQQRTLQSMNADDIRDAVRKAGIVGMGGAAFPTHVKYSPPPETDIDTIILNGCECEPFLTCDHRIMLEEADEIVSGLQAIMKACGAERGLIGIEDNKPDAVEAMREAVRDHPYQVEVLETKYPEGAEKQLIDALLGREVPSGGLPLDIGVVVNNVATAVAVSRAVKRAEPLTKRVVTVTGDAVKQPKNVRVRVGAPIRQLLEASGGFSEAPARIISGGPMMGTAIYDLDIPITKGTSGIVALSHQLAADASEEACIRCARCVEACPISLMPLYLAEYDQESALQYNPLDCIECGSCSYVCPSNRQLVQRIRLTKATAQAEQEDSS